MANVTISFGPPDFILVITTACDASEQPLTLHKLIQGTHAGIIRSYNVFNFFRFYIYKAIRKVLFLPIFSKRSYKGLIFVSCLNFNNKKLASCHMS